MFLHSFAPPGQVKPTSQTPRRLALGVSLAVVIVSAAACPLAAQAEDNAAPVLRLPACDTVLQLSARLPPSQEPAEHPVQRAGKRPRDGYKN